MPRLTSRQRVAKWRAAHIDQSRQQTRASYARHRQQRLATAQAKFQRLKANGYTDAYRERDRAKKQRRRAKTAGVAATLTHVEWTDICRRYDQRCAYCGERKRLEQDHVVPLSKGGTHTAGNVVPACKSCNSAKGNRLIGAA